MAEPNIVVSLDERRIAEAIIREMKHEIRDLIKKQLKEVAFQMELFANSLDD